ncbi:MAG: hypothetical protein E7448_04220 [Ruminococcaceae bacterium]|nr:hypothetical protein [Oscillospiraceae bacterium]
MQRFKLLCVALAVMLLFSCMDVGIMNSIAVGEEKKVSMVLEEQKLYASATINDDFDDSHIIVVLSNAASLAKFQYRLNDFSEVNCKSITNMTQSSTDIVATKISEEKMSEQRDASSEYVTFSGYHEVNTEEFNQILLLELAEPGKENVLVAINKLEQRTDVIYAGPNYFLDCEANEASETSLVRTSSNDLISEQWALDTINLPDAWEIEIGMTRKVVVGIIDSGIDGSHPDFGYAVNASKSRDIDTDGVAHTVTVATDSTGHGTMVAGVIGAMSHNTIGISGVNWDVELVSLKLLRNSQGKSSVAAMIKALLVAQELGVQILNMSTHITEYNGYVPGITQAANAFGGLIVCAAGNNGTELQSNHMLYPTCLDIDNMIVVGASTRYDYVWIDSNYSAEIVDLFAPGHYILSTYPTAMCSSDTCSPFEHHSNGYHYGDGTSLAAPYVTGVASLLMAMYADYTISVDAMIYHIKNGVDVMQPYQGKCVTGGRLNAYKVLSEHNFALTCDQYDSTRHRGYCLCGDAKLMPHTWIYTGDMRICSGCSYYEYI